MMAGVTRAKGAVEVEQASAPEHTWLYNHIGRLSGIALGLVVLLVVVFLAVAGYQAATSLLIVAVSGFLLIAVGGLLRGGR